MISWRAKFYDVDKRSELGCRYLLRQSVPDARSSNRKSPVTDDWCHQSVISVGRADRQWERVVPNTALMDLSKYRILSYGWSGDVFTDWIIPMNYDLLHVCYQPVLFVCNRTSKLYVALTVCCQTCFVVTVMTGYMWNNRSYLTYSPITNNLLDLYVLFISFVHFCHLSKLSVINITLSDNVACQIFCK